MITDCCSNNMYTVDNQCHLSSLGSINQSLKLYCSLGTIRCRDRGYFFKPMRLHLLSMACNNDSILTCWINTSSHLELSIWPLLSPKFYTIDPICHLFIDWHVYWGTKCQEVLFNLDYLLLTIHNAAIIW